MNDAKRLDWRHWLAAARHPARQDGAIAVALLVLPWVIALALALVHHLGATAVTILASASVGLPALWLAWVPIRNASRSGAPSTAIPGDDARVEMRGESRDSSTFTQIGTQVIQPPLPEQAFRPWGKLAAPAGLSGGQTKYAGKRQWADASPGPAV